MVAMLKNLVDTVKKPLMSFQFMYWNLFQIIWYPNAIKCLNYLLGGFLIYALNLFDKSLPLPQWQTGHIYLLYFFPNVHSVGET